MGFGTQDDPATDYDKSIFEELLFPILFIMFGMAMGFALSSIIAL